jgi:hypothetical protein
VTGSNLVPWTEASNQTFASAIKFAIVRILLPPPAALLPPHLLPGKVTLQRCKCENNGVCGCRGTSSTAPSSGMLAMCPPARQPLGVSCCRASSSQCTMTWTRYAQSVWHFVYKSRVNFQACLPFSAGCSLHWPVPTSVHLHFDRRCRIRVASQRNCGTKTRCHPCRML